LDEARSRNSPARFMRLWQGAWVPASTGAIDPADLEAAILKPASKHQPPPGPMSGSEPGYRFVAGLDLGVKKDHSALVVLGCHGETQRIRLAWCQSWAPPRGGEVDLTAVQSAVLDAHHRYRLAAVNYDPSQALLMSQTLRRAGVPMQEVSFSSPQNLTRMATTLIDLFRSRGRLELYRDELLVKDLLRLTITEKGGHGMYKLEAASDAEGHADRGIAFALALMHAVNTAGSGAGSQTLVPRGGLVMGAPGSRPIPTHPHPIERRGTGRPFVVNPFRIRNPF
jgi:hypothetical protein